MILNYDFTYLAILLSEPEEPGPCTAGAPASPVRGGRTCRPRRRWSWRRTRA